MKGDTPNEPNAIGIHYYLLYKTERTIDVGVLTGDYMVTVEVDGREAFAGSEDPASTRRSPGSAASTGAAGS